MTPGERERFDALLEDVLAALPAHLHDLLREKPLVVDDRPSRELLEELDLDPDDDSLCGLHTGTALTERSVEREPQVEVIQIFREGIVDHAGGWDAWLDEDGSEQGGEARIAEEIRITVLHEIGHHFGLDEDDLAELGYD